VARKLKGREGLGPRTHWVFSLSVQPLNDGFRSILCAQEDLPRRASLPDGPLNTSLTCFLPCPAHDGRDTQYSGCSVLDRRQVANAVARRRQPNPVRYPHTWLRDSLTRKSVSFFKMHLHGEKSLVIILRFSAGSWRGTRTCRVPGAPHLPGVGRCGRPLRAFPLAHLN
jgi:hypothetical protein